MPFKYRLPRILFDMICLGIWLFIFVLNKWGWKELFIYTAGMLWVIFGTLINAYMQGLWNMINGTNRILRTARDFRAIGKILRGDFIDADKN